jgi:hypothetical protein
MADQYVVTAPLVSVKTMTIEGVRLINLYTGAPVPADADPGWVERHLEAKMIAKVADPAAVSVAVLSPQEMQDVNADGRRHHEEVYDRVAEQEQGAARRRAAAKAAETRRDNEAKGDDKGDDKGEVKPGEAKQPEPVKAPEPVVKPAEPVKSPAQPVVARPVNQGPKAGK